MGEGSGGKGGGKWGKGGREMGVKGEGSGGKGGGKGGMPTPLSTPSILRKPVCSEGRPEPDCTANVIEQVLK